MMNVIKSPQCTNCLTWKVPHLTQTVSYLDNPSWALIWYCPDPKCYEETQGENL